MTDDRVPGVVIDHIPASTVSYVGSPSIVAVANGSYVATHDLFGSGSTYSRTKVFRSDDRGLSWRSISEIEGAFWCNLFVHKGALYLMGVSRQYGYAVIRRSQDGGATWTAPIDGDTGLLRDDGRYHTAPMPVIEHRGRLWRAMEDLKPDSERNRDFRAFVLSANVDADLLSAASWMVSDRVEADYSDLGGHFGGWLEGNVVVTPDGDMVDVLRADYRVRDGEYAAIIRISDDGSRATFDPEDFVRFPGGCKKFTIRHDAQSGSYWTLSNTIAEGYEDHNVERIRNTLALMSSPDLRVWSIRDEVLHHPQVEDHAFQYVDWQFDGEDLIVASRTAYDDGVGGAHNQHDANYMTFHRVDGFRAMKVVS